MSDAPATPGERPISAIGSPREVRPVSGADPMPGRHRLRTHLYRRLPVHRSTLIGYLIAALVLAAVPVRAGPAPDPDIVGGTQAGPDEFPFMVALVHADEPNTFQAQFCGGSLIDAEWVLTAGHCVHGAPPGDVEVYANDYDLKGDGDRIEVDAIFIHPEYDGSTLENDMALLRLAEPAKVDPGVNDTVRLAIPADWSQFDEGDLATVIGWGDTEEQPPGTPEFPRRLRKAEVPVQSNQDCAGAYSGFDFPEMICAGFDLGAVDSCQGDSGGPLLIPQGDGTHLQVGIVSWGIGCADPEKFGVYTRVATYACFIAETIDNGMLGYGRATTEGTPDGDHLVGTAGSDIILGWGGSDLIEGLAGGDVLCGGEGVDQLIGGPGADLLDGGPGNDTLKGHRGQDTVLGGDGDDRVLGNKGDDGLIGGAGLDEIKGHRGDDWIDGEADADDIRGGPDNDVARGGDGNDIVRGGPGFDILRGGGGDDELRGGEQDDVLIGGSGFDTIIGGSGDDQCEGEVLSSCES